MNYQSSSIATMCMHRCMFMELNEDMLNLYRIENKLKPFHFSSPLYNSITHNTHIQTYTITLTIKVALN